MKDLIEDIVGLLCLTVTIAGIAVFLPVLFG